MCIGFDQLLFMSLFKLCVFQNPNTGKEEISFIFQKMHYRYDAEEKKRFEAVQFPVSETFRKYMEWKGYQEDTDIKQAEREYGKNQ